METVETFLRQPAARRIRQFQTHLLLDKFASQLVDKLVNHPLHVRRGQRVELYPGVEAVAELGAEGALNRGLGLGCRSTRVAVTAFRAGGTKADLLAGDFTGARRWWS